MAALDKDMVDIEKLRCLLEEAQIVKTHMELILMNPQMDPAIRKKYTETLPSYKNRIKGLRHEIALYQKMEESQKTGIAPRQAEPCQELHAHSEWETVTHAAEQGFIRNAQARDREFPLQCPGYGP